MTVKNRYLLVFALPSIFWLNAGTASAQSQSAPTLIFEDNFGNTDDEVRSQDVYGPSCQADSCKWVLGRTNPLAADVCLDRNNISAVPGGGMRITARHGDFSMAKPDGGTLQCAYSSAYLQSRKFFTYGYFEIKAKVPIGRGLSPALWLFTMGRNGELDLIDGQGSTKFGGNIFYWRDKPVTIVQGVLDPVANTVMPTIARGGYGGAPQKHADYSTSFRLSRPARSLSDQYHTYAVDWQPTGITFYFDGQAYFSTNRTLNDPMMLVLDYEVNSKTVDPASLSQTLDVKYIRVYDHAPRNRRPSPGMPVLQVQDSVQGSYDLPQPQLTASPGFGGFPFQDDGPRRGKKRNRIPF